MTDPFTPSFSASYAGAARMDPARTWLLPLLCVVPLAGSLVFGSPTYLAALGTLMAAALLFLVNIQQFVLMFMVVIAMRGWMAGGERIGAEGLDFDLGGLVNILACLIGGVYYLVLWKNPFKGRVLAKPYLLLLALFTVSIIWAPHLRQAIRFVTRLIAPFATYLIISDVLDRRMVRRLIQTFYWSSVIPIIVGFYQLFTGHGAWAKWQNMPSRVQSCFVHPAHFSMYLLFIFCLAYAEFLDGRRVNKLLWVGYLALISVLQIATYTRISWIATALCFAYLSWMYGRRRYLVVATVLGTLFMAVFGSSFVGSLILDRVQEVSSILSDEIAMEDVGNSIGWRLYFWRHLLDDWASSPWLGHGAGSSILFGWRLNGVWSSPHNGYLRVLYEGGLVGLGIFLWLLWV
ncbi:MAG: O-antigen ligase family protein, partial [Myxococcota bacterium]|nr:O-antigen ligase family protein [Myxococcota bacterium]